MVATAQIGAGDARYELAGYPGSTVVAFADGAPGNL